MPRVTKRTKNRGGKTGEYRCVRCPDPIVAGEEFYVWAFRYGGTHRQHVKHGYPRQSQLTQSKLGEVYAAIEEVEDLLGSEGWEPSDVKQAVENVAEVGQQVVDEYRDAAENFGGGGQNAELADELESFVSDVEGAASNLDVEFESDGEREERPCVTCAGAGQLDAEIDADGNVIRTETCVDCGGEGHREKEPNPDALEEWRDQFKADAESAIEGAP